MMRHTGGLASGETSTRSSPASSASAKASSLLMRPMNSFSSSMTRVSARSMSSLRRGPVFMSRRQGRRPRPRRPPPPRRPRPRASTSTEILCACVGPAATARARPACECAAREERRAWARLAAGFAARAMIVARVEAAALAARAAITGATEAEATEHDIIMGSAFSALLSSPRDSTKALVACGAGRDARAWATCACAGGSRSV